MDLCKGVEYWDSWRIACLRKPFSSHVINKVVFMHLCDKLVNSLSCSHYHGIFERFVMLSIVELGLSFVYFITFVHDDSSCTFICLFYNDFSVVFKLFESFMFVA